jgi:lysophospholipase L1-like esterase
MSFVSVRDVRERANLAPLLALLSAAAMFVLAAAPAAASTPQFDPPKSFYLALGDSLAFGYQQYKFNANFPAEDPSVFSSGYVNDFSAMLQAVNPSLQTVNFGCPGETTATFLAGPCLYEAAGFPLHNGYSGAQMDAALNFLRDHPGQVSPITIDIGADDVRACNFDPGCVPGAIATAVNNLSTILSKLRAAAPDAEIIVMTYYNPYALIDPSTNTGAEALNAAIAADATAAGGRVADAFTPFDLAAAEPATLCALTLMCTPLQDIHASDAGYMVIAQQFWSASDYSKLIGQ